MAAGARRGLVVVNLRDMSDSAFRKELELLGYNVTLIRKRKGLKQADLAKLAGTTQAMVSAVEQGKGNFRYTTVLALAQALSVSMMELHDPSLITMG